jgi:hypothetical protein
VKLAAAVPRHGLTEAEKAKALLAGVIVAGGLGRAIPLTSRTERKIAGAILACWSLVHGLTLLLADGLVGPKKKSGALLHWLSGDIGVPPPYGPMDFASWFEAYLSGRWYTFDPRNNMPRNGRVLIAQARDAADVPITHTFGPNTLVSFKVWTEEVS